MVGHTLLILRGVLSLVVLVGEEYMVRSWFTAVANATGSRAEILLNLL